MRLCYTVATPECEDRSMLALQRPLAESFRLLSESGYSAAELMVRDPGSLDAAAIAGQARDFGLRLPAVSTGQLRKEEGHQLCSLDERARGLAVDAMRGVIDFAAECGSGVVNIGTLRGQLPEGEGRPRALAAAGVSLRAALDHAAGVNVRIAIEPQCRYVSNWINSVREGQAFLEPFQRARPGLAFDFYHALLEEPSVLAALIRARADVAWVQVSDSNRRAPGLGQQNFGEFIRVLRALDYNGYVSVECTQTPDDTSAVRAAARHLLPFLEESLS